MGTVTASGTPMGIGDALITAILGYAVVFVGLVLLMVVIIIVGKIMSSKSKKAAPEAASASNSTAAAPVKSEKAPGTAGGIMLYDTPERDAAMAMAIVANKMGKPLNEIRFISIKEVK